MKVKAERFHSLQLLQDVYKRQGCMVDDIENVRRLSRMGVEIQVNASSINVVNAVSYTHLPAGANIWI